GPAERAVGELRRDVEERPRGRGDWDPVVTSEVVRLEGRRAVDAQAGVDPRPVLRTVTSGCRWSHWTKPQSAAAEKWLSTPSGAHAFTAARKRPSSGGLA